MDSTFSQDDRLPSVLIVHNRYAQRGGEDVVVDAEIELLASNGVRVRSYIPDSGDEAQLRKLTTRPHYLASNPNVRERIRETIRSAAIDIVHCHNLFPMVSTSVYRAAALESVPVVQTVHNYRMGCLNGLHLRDGQICELCRPGHHVNGVLHGCYRGSRLQSAAFGMAQSFNSWRDAWSMPQTYIVPTEFLKGKLMSWGIPAAKVVIKPHFIPDDPGHKTARGEHALFAGRLSEEKGIDLLLDIWSPERVPLLVVGDGPQRKHLQHRIDYEGKTNVKLVGYKNREEMRQLLAGSRFLVMPSQWYETFGLVLIEAFAQGVPVIASRLGALTYVVSDGETGFLFDADNPADLLEKVRRLEGNAVLATRMGDAARAEYLDRFSASANLTMLLEIYRDAIQRNGKVVANAST